MSLQSLSAYVNWNDIPGHLAYIIIAISYLLTNIFWLRIAAVVGLALEIFYFVVTGSGLWTSVFWDTIFILINLVQVALLVRDRLSLRLTADQKAFLAPLMAELDKAQIAQLLRTGAWKTLDSGHILTREGEPVTDLTFICDGQTEVRVRDQTIAHVGPGNFIGDVSFAMGSPATATVLAEGEVRVLAFDQVRLKALCTKDQQIASAMYRRIGGGLATKMKSATGKL
jgi:CRP-like cAMP-binding protein